MFGRLTDKAKGLARGIKQALGLAPTLTPKVRDALEEALLNADVGQRAADALLNELERHIVNGEAVQDTLATLLTEQLTPCERPLTFEGAPTVILVCGVNGSGKTTTIGKLADLLVRDGKRVVVGAADTFRAGAVEQLKVWGERAGVPVVVPSQEGADPAGVAYAAVERGLADNVDVVLVDTAGRLTTRKDLMDELGKVVRVVRKLDPAAPHATLLVLDGTLGQSTLPQVRDFRAVVPVTGLIVTKLDSSAKGGFLLALAAEEAPLPVHYIGLGEAVGDLEPFTAARFVEGMGLKE